jgi:hypothetical protein
MFAFSAWPHTKKSLSARSISLALALQIHAVQMQFAQFFDVSGQSVETAIITAHIYRQGNFRLFVCKMLVTSMPAHLPRR